MNGFNDFIIIDLLSNLLFLVDSQELTLVLKVTRMFVPVYNDHRFILNGPYYMAHIFFRISIIFEKCVHFRSVSFWTPTVTFEKTL